MVRKNLSDLLKEEAQKSAEPQEITVEAKLVVEDSASETEANSEAENADATNHRRTSPTKAELETTVKELQTALEAAQGENQDLRSQLQEQKTLVEKVEKLQSELDQAKQTILKLTETNSKPNSKSSSKLSAKPPASSALARPIQPTSLPDVPSSAFTDKDLGWFD
jgi:predicted RNase H-like nuclease (RuvC/YqgF family)